MHEAEVAAVRAGQDLDHRGRLAVRADGQDDAFVGPVHGASLDEVRRAERGWSERRWHVGGLLGSVSDIPAEDRRRIVVGIP